MPGLVAMPGVVLAAGSILTSDRASAWVSVGYWLLMAVILRWSARDYFRAGWNAGFGRGLEAGVELRGDHVPFIVRRVYGSADASPEPWDRPWDVAGRPR